MRLHSMISSAIQSLKLPSLHNKHQQGVPKGHFTVYVGESEKKKYVLPLSYLGQPGFQKLLKYAEEEFGFNHPTESMGNHAVGICKCAKLVTKKGSISCQEKTAIPVPKGHFAVYVGEEGDKRFVVPVSYLKHPCFQEILREAEEKFGYDHGMGRLTVPCSESYFINLISQLRDLE